LSPELPSCDKFPDNVVSAGIDPVSPGKGIRFRTQQIYIINHIPRAVHLCIPKKISVIPFPDYFEFIFQMVVFQKLLYVFGGKLNISF
jgi:hypothetical protein